MSSTCVSFVTCFAHLFNISQVREGQRKGSCPHCPTVPKGAPTIKLVPGWLVHITELGGGQLLQHLDHPRTITTTRGCTVLLSKSEGMRYLRFSVLPLI